MWRKLINIYKKNRLLVILMSITIVFIAINFGALIDFTKKVDYTYRDFLFYNIGRDNVVTNVDAISMDVHLSTNQAFIPQQKIKVIATVSIPKLLEMANPNSKLYIWFPYSQQTESTRRNQNIDNFFSEEENFFVIRQNRSLEPYHGPQVLKTKQDGLVVLNKSESGDYTGEGEIIYKHPGDFHYILLGSYDVILESESTVPIGTTVDLFSVRNNRLILFLTLYTITITIILSFKKN